MRGTGLSLLLALVSFTNASVLRAFAATIFFVKQELPFAETLDEVTVLATQTSPAATLGVFGEKSIINFDPPASAKPGVDYNISAVFEDSSPASIAIAVGSGVVHYAAYHPGLSYMQPAMPRRPVDRTAHLDGYTHFVPTEFDAGARDMLARAVAAAGGSGTAPRCSDPLVEVGHISSPAGTLLPLINWNTPGNQTSYWKRDNYTRVTVDLSAVTPAPKFATATLASCGVLTQAACAAKQGGVVRLNASGLLLSVDVALADAIILR